MNDAEQRARDALRHCWEADEEVADCFLMTDGKYYDTGAEVDQAFEDWREAARERDKLYDEFDRIINENGLDTHAIVEALAEDFMPHDNRLRGCATARTTFSAISLNLYNV